MPYWLRVQRGSRVLAQSFGSPFRMLISPSRSTAAVATCAPATCRGLLRLVRRTDFLNSRLGVFDRKSSISRADNNLKEANSARGDWFQSYAPEARKPAAFKCFAIPHKCHVACRYFATTFLLFFGTPGIAARAPLSCASLASLRARRRSMFLRTAVARCSASTIARTPSSWAKRFLLARAMLSGEGATDFLLTTLSGFPT